MDSRASLARTHHGEVDEFRLERHQGDRLEPDKCAVGLVSKVQVDDAEHRLDPDTVLAILIETRFVREEHVLLFEARFEGGGGISNIKFCSTGLGPEVQLLSAPLQELSFLS